MYTLLHSGLNADPNMSTCTVWFFENVKNQPQLSALFLQHNALKPLLSNSNRACETNNSGQVHV